MLLLTPTPPTSHLPNNTACAFTLHVNVENVENKLWKKNHLDDENDDVTSHGNAAPWWNPEPWRR